MSRHIEPEDPATLTNRTFHEAYDVSRTIAAHGGPVLVVLGDDLVLVCGNGRTVEPFTPPLLHTIKSVAHAPVAILACSYRAVAGVLDGDTLRRMRTLSRSLDQLEGTLVSPLGGDEHVFANLRRVTALTRRYLERPLSGARIDAGGLATFASSVGPALLQSVRDATAIQLRALHTHALKLLHRLDAPGRRDVEVVVVGEHQARARSLPMQYFARLFGETVGEETRVTYAEGASTVDDALQLVGTRRLDRQIAEALFGRPGRLQRDVLGDAARDQLAASDILPLR